MTEKLRKNLLAKKRKEVMAKFNSTREDFKKKQKEVKTDLEEAKDFWNRLSEKFKWWQSLP